MALGKAAQQTKRAAAVNDQAETPKEVRNAGPQRIFEAGLPLLLRSGKRMPDTEDKELTAFVLQVFQELTSSSLQPPACGRCDGRNTVLRQTNSRTQSYPVFFCHDCQQHFNRLTGTPLAGMRRRDTVESFVPYLSQQRPVKTICAESKIDPRRARDWIKRFRKWLLQIDPSGHWEAKVRLGIRPPALNVRCPHCGHVAPLRGREFSMSKPGGPDTVETCKASCNACWHRFEVPQSALIALDAEAQTLAYTEMEPGDHARQWTDERRKLISQKAKARFEQSGRKPFGAHQRKPDKSNPQT